MQSFALAHITAQEAPFLLFMELSDGSVFHTKY